MELVFATNNKHKFTEINQLLTGNIRLLNLGDIQCDDDLPETKETLEGNAEQKARYVYDHYSLNCFADDTGLEIDALDGRPGVYSARYAGELKRPEDNMNKVLHEMNNIVNRKARFRTVIALVINGKTIFFDGTVHGEILEEKRGKKGFGYDPIFLPDGYQLTFAEMALEEKNFISHRGQAVARLINYLNNQYTK